MNHHNERTAANLKRVLADIFQRHLADPRIRGMITITKIEIKDQSRTAIVSVSVFPENHEPMTIKGLQAATLHIQKLANDKLDMRRPPHLKFQLDKTIKKEAELLAAINKANNEE